MTNVIILSGLAGSGKTYVAEKVKEIIKDLFDIKWFGATADNIQSIIDSNKHEEFMILEMHPPFNEFDESYFKANIKNFKHVVISKDWSEYNLDISRDKIKFIDDFFNKNPKRVRWNKDMIKYNKARFGHIDQAELSLEDYEIATSCDDAISMIVHFAEKIRRKELFDFANKNYDYMLYHSPDYNGICYEGTAPSQIKFSSLKLWELGITKEKSCLDVGCNVGYISYLLSEYFDGVDGIDILEENIKCARWLKSKFFRNDKITFNPRDMMDCVLPYDYVFALAVLHHIALKHKFEDIVKKLSDLTKIAAVIEINEMPGWSIDRIKKELLDYFKEVKIIGNSYLPVGKQIAKDRWIIHCIK